MDKEEEKLIKERIERLLESKDEEFRILGASLLDVCDLEKEDKYLLISSSISSFLANKDLVSPNNIQFLKIIIDLNTKLHENENIFKKRINKINDDR